MPTTQELVSLLKEEYAPSYSRTRILYLLDWAQRQMFCTDCAQHLYYNRADDTFFTPILKTTDGVLDYQIDDDALVDSDGNDLAITYYGTSVTCRKVWRLYFKGGTLDSNWYDQRWYGQEIFPVGINQFYANRFLYTRFFEVPCVTINKTQIGSAALTFTENPGTTTDKFFVDFYMNPPKLTSESIPLVVNADVWEWALIQGVMARIEDVKHGTNDRMKDFKKEVAKYKHSQNISDAQKTPLKCRRREAG
jgi:hypothetical protein